MNLATDYDIRDASLVQLHASALLVGSAAFFNNRRDQLVTLAAAHAVPAIYEWREFAAAGGLISYGPSLTVAVLGAGLLGFGLLRRRSKTAAASFGRRVGKGPAAQIP